MSQRKNNIIKSVFSVTGVILISKLMGFIKQMVTAGTFGATIETDLISLSRNFIGNIQYVLVQTLLTAFVVVYIHTREEDEQAAKELPIAVGKAFTMIACAIVAAVVIFAPSVARIIAPSYSQELTARLAGYLRVFAPALILFVWIAVFHALLDANRRFIPGQLEGLSQSVVLILLILFVEPYLGVNTLVVSFFTYTLWNVLFLGGVSRHEWKKAPGNPFANPAVRKLIHMIVPLLLGYSMVYINQQVAKILSSGLPAGTVTAMDYAAVLSNLVGTFVATFCSILFAYITSHISQGKQEQAAAVSVKSGLLMIMVFLPVAILTFIYAEDIVRIAFGRGEFGEQSVLTTALALKGYALSFVPLVLQNLFSRFQYSYQDSKTPMINSSIGIVANVILSVLLCPNFGVFGITFASAVSSLICGLLNAVTARRHNECLTFGPMIRKLPWLCIGGAGCAVASIWCGRMLVSSGSLVRFACATLCGGAVYAVILLPVLLNVLKEIRKERQ